MRIIRLEDGREITLDDEGNVVEDSGVKKKPRESGRSAIFGFVMLNVALGLLILARCKG